MEEEIDLLQYIVVLIKYWPWIIGLAIVAALVAFAASSLIPPIYQATALVTATQSRYELQFDPRFRNIPDSAIESLLESQYRTYPTLSTSDDLLQQVADETGWSMNSLKEAVEARADDAPNLLSLTAEGQNAAEVANVANTWAALFVAKANSLYGSSGELERFKQQQDIVAQSLAQADTALTAFREENGFGFSSNDESQPGFDNNGFGLIGQRLQSMNSLLTDYEAELVRLHQMQREVELLSETTTAHTSPVLIAGLLSEMINTGIAKDTRPYQIKLDSVDPVASLAAMARTLQSRTIAIEAEMETLQENTAAVQTELAAKQEQLEQLTRERDVKAETFAVISRKVQEAQIDASSEGSSAGKVQIASRAAVPTEPINARRLLNAVIAGLLGLMAGVFGAFALEWWRNSEALSPAREVEKRTTGKLYGEPVQTTPTVDDAPGRV